MPKVAIIRCEENEDECPMTACFASLKSRKAAFEIYEEECDLMGVYTCHCPGDCAVDLASDLKSRGAQVIHFCTCTFATQVEGRGWVMENGGLCNHDIDQIIERVHNATGLPCVKGTAHLPKNYTIQKWE
ncbi:MAG: CGGC domain-containing protein [Dehalococcoidia bacterium]